MATDPGDAGRQMREVGALSSVGLSLVIAIVIGVAGGYGIDRLFGTSPWGFLIGFFLGLAGGMRSIFKTVASVSRHDGP